MYVSALKLRISLYLAKEAQLALLLTKKVTVPSEYSYFADVFLEKLANILPERTRANENSIKLEKRKQPPYGPIWSLEPVELETLKTYIKTNLANGFIQASKSLAGVPILFVRKLNGSRRLCVNYQKLNNLIIKNWYLLSLIGKSLDQLSQAKWFTQLALTSAYHKMKIKEVDK